MQLNVVPSSSGTEALVPSTAITASAAGAAKSGYAAAEVLIIQVDATAKTGTNPTLDVKIQDSADGTNWFDVPSASITQLTDVGHGLIRVDLSKGIADFIRAYYAIGGTSTPGYTFSVTAYAKAKASTI